ncbi:MAG: hypothetical protein RAP03_10470 [Candidatus Electryonea clarkiae]|nr:hypothetical protein [Candidatus Electryonea clarkiae]
MIVSIIYLILAIVAIYILHKFVIRRKLILYILIVVGYIYSIFGVLDNLMMDKSASFTIVDAIGDGSANVLRLAILVGAVALIIKIFRKK